MRKRRRASQWLSLSAGAVPSRVVSKGDQVAGVAAAAAVFPSFFLPALRPPPDLHTNASVVAQNGETRVYKLFIFSD